MTHPKFFFFDAGVYRTLRPRGPLDSDQEIDGAAIETLLLESLRAKNAGRELGYDISHWRTTDGKEVDFVLYGERGLHAFEVKRSPRFRESDTSSAISMSRPLRRNFRAWVRCCPREPETLAAALHARECPSRLRRLHLCSATSP